MAALIVRRVGRLLLVLWLVSLATFFLVDLIPGDPVANIYGTSATPEQIERARQALGLDRGVVPRYLDWLGGLVRGDLGDTLVSPVRPVAEVLASAVPVTLELAVLAIVIALAVSIPLGALASYRENTALDRLVNGSTFAMLALPAFVSSLLLILLVVFNTDAVRQAALVLGLAGSAALVIGAVRRKELSGSPVHWAGYAAPALVGLVVFLFLTPFPRQDWVRLSEDVGGNLQHAFLPSLTLALTLIPLYTQLLRTDMIQTLRQPFVTIARAKGASPARIIVVEALRPSLFSLVTVAGISLGALLGGSVVVETVFGLPGLGRTLVQAIVNSDYLVVQAGVLVTALIFVVINTLVDLSYQFLDPRIRRAERV